MKPLAEYRRLKCMAGQSCFPTTEAAERARKALDDAGIVTSPVLPAGNGWYSFAADVDCRAGKSFNRDGTR